MLIMYREFFLLNSALQSGRPPLVVVRQWCRPLYSEQSTDKHNLYRGADKSLARPTSRTILFDDEKISFDASLVIYI